jgi:hypothetical protein
MKGFDVEQFLMLTMVLATAGAVGVGIYSTRGDDEAPAAAQSAEAAEEEAFPEAAPEAPVAAPAEVAPVAPAAPLAPVPSLDAAPEVLDEAPGPQVEGMSW